MPEFSLGYRCTSCSVTTEQVNLVAARKAVQFTHCPANATKVRQVLQSAIAALPPG